MPSQFEGTAVVIFLRSATRRERFSRPLHEMSTGKESKESLEAEAEVQKEIQTFCSEIGNPKGTKEV
jgi:hypothetical protein